MNPNQNDPTQPATPNTSQDSMQSDFARSFEESLHVAPPPKPSAKPVIMVAGLVIILVTLFGVVGWLAATSPGDRNNATLSLKSYDTDDFSVLVPEGYEEGKALGNDIIFSEPSEDEQTQSTESVGFIEAALINSSQRHAVEQVESQLTAAEIKQSLRGNPQLVDYKVEKTTVNGRDARKITAVTTKDGKDTGALRMIMIFGEEKFYYVIVIAHADDSGLANSAEQILSSFKIK